MKILILRFGSLGDIVLATPLIRALRENFPQSWLAFGLKKKYASLLEADPFLNEIIPLETEGRHKGVWGLLRFSRELKKKKFDLVVDIHRNLRSIVLSWLLRPSLYLPYSKGRIKRFFRIYFKKNFPSSHTIERYLSSLNPLGFRVRVKTPYLVVGEEKEKKVRFFLQKKGVKDKDLLLGIAPGSRWFSKRWKEEGFAWVANRLGEKYGLKPVLMGEKEEKALTRKILSLIKVPALDLTGATDPGELSALIKRLTLLLSNDSAPMHIASAVRTPVVAIFCSTTPDLGFSPWGKRVRVVERKNLPCRPCSPHGGERCPLKHFKCRDISPEEVIEVAEELLQKVWRDEKE